MPLSDAFETHLTAAVVRQFFENPPIVGNLADGTPFHVPARPTPAAAVAARLLAEKNDELLNAIMAAIDLDALATLVAERVAETLKVPTNAFYIDTGHGAEARKALKKQVNERLVDLLARDAYDRLNAATDATDED